MKLIPLVLSVAMLTTPLTIPVVQAQSSPLTQNIPALQGVNLSQTQKDQFDQLRQQTRSQINAIVTSEQQQQFFNALQNGQGLRGAIAAANLSDQQRTQVRQVLQASRSQAAEILPPQQRQQIFKNLRAR